MPIIRQRSHFFIDVKLIDVYAKKLTPADLALYIGMCRMSDGSEHDIDSGFMGLCLDEIAESRENLQRYGLIRFTESKEGKHTVYHIFITDSSEWHDSLPLDDQPSRTDAIVRLKAMRYADYLKSDHWQSMRRVAMSRASGRCQLCNTKSERLHVYHRTYIRRGCEWPEDLVVLCKTCHDIFHQNSKLSKEG